MEEIAGRTGWRTVAVGDSGGRALIGAGGREMRRWGALALLAGAAVCAIAMLMPARPFAPATPGNHVLPAHHGLQRHQTASLPASLAAAASSSIGASERSFWPVRRGPSLMARGGGIHSSFTAAGAHLGVARGTLGLSLTAIGRGQRSERIAPVAPQLAANQVLYRHGSVSELYRSGPYGLEQSFALPHRPTAGAGSLVLTLSVKGSLVPQQAGSQALFRTPGGATALRYGQLSALDATGRALPAHIQVVNRTLQLRVDDSGARYPLLIDPFIQQGAKLTGSGETGEGFFGASVALSSDGNTALIGGSSDNKGVGAAWAFTRSGSTWTQQGAKLTATGETGEGQFGTSVALSADGNTALIGGSGDNKGVGAAWVFTRLGSTWTQQGATLTGTGETGEGLFGGSVALSSDGNTALIGAANDNKKVGAVWVFTRSGSTWTQQGAKLTGTGETGEGEFGNSVALGATEGNTALIGGSGDNKFIGAAWVFTRSVSTWTQQGAKLTGTGETGEGEFGNSVALASTEGNTALIGGRSDNLGIGAVWAFTRSGSTWTQQGAKLTAKEKEELGMGLFGEGVALSSSGNTALIGGPSDNKSVGAAWVFTRSGSTWTQKGEKLTGAGEIGEGLFGFGKSVALSAEGSTALIGGPGDNSKVGAAWAFVEGPAPPAVVTGAATSVTESSATLSATVNPNAQTVTDCHFEYGPTEAYGSTAPCSPSPGSGEFKVAVSAAITGLTKITYHYRISATNASGTSRGKDRRFTANPPIVTTEPATSVAPTSATLNAKVNPNGGEISACKFEYGTTTSYGFVASCKPFPPPGESAVAVSASVVALTPNTTYHFRISATNQGGTSTGSDVIFITPPNPPTAVTESASNVTLSSAKLNGTVNPNSGEVTECKFEYGTTTSYGTSAPCTPPPGAGNVPVAVSASVSGLAANTIYHFRVSATNAGGTSTGLDATFATSTPHYYVNGAKIKEGPAFTKTAIMWGTITLANVKGGITGSFVTCRSADAGTLFNPAGGAAGEGQIQVFATFACESEKFCPVGQSAAIVAEGLPWHTLLTEEVPGTIRQEATGVKLFIECLLSGKVESGQMFVLGAGEKGLRPRTVEGTSALHPGVLEFGEGSGELEWEGSVGAVTRRAEGAVKMMGYNAQELIESRTP